MGKFNGGNENINRDGRPKGSFNKKTLIWKEIGDWFTNDALEIYKANLLKLMQSENKREATEGMKRYETLLEYFKPKLQRTEIKAEVKSDNVDLSKYSTKDLEDSLGSNED